MFCAVWEQRIPVVGSQIYIIKLRLVSVQEAMTKVESMGTIHLLDMFGSAVNGKPEAHCSATGRSQVATGSEKSNSRCNLSCPWKRWAWRSGRAEKRIRLNSTHEVGVRTCGRTSQSTGGAGWGMYTRVPDDPSYAGLPITWLASSTSRPAHSASIVPV